MLALVQEYVPGPCVDEWAKTNDSAHECISILHQIACGISDIHHWKKIHRDIKPSNIKLDAEGVVKILDFGLSQRSSPSAETVFSRGTKYYLAPELYGRPPIKITRAADIFAFGVTAAVVCHRGALPKELKVVPPINLAYTFENSLIKLPIEVARMLNSTLEDDPGDRPKMREVRDVLERRLLFGKHRAVISTPRGIQFLSTPGKQVTLQRGSDLIAIAYDGLTFTIRSVSGDVYINNTRANTGDNLPGSCVITMGAPLLGPDRMFFPVDMSHPGVES
jgi:serine/threonine-protein kinase